jgi:hypothetical protein
MARPPALLAGMLLASMLATKRAASEPKAVIELFTSQGCSSCRSADAYFEGLADRDDVIALSLHVDYWNYLGWEDTFSHPEHSERQLSYAEAHGTKRVYTPQIVVNGTTDVVGNHVGAVEAAIAMPRSRCRSASAAMAGR